MKYNPVEEERKGGERKKVKGQFPKLLLDGMDCFISVPVLKVHVVTGLSLSLKNLWGYHPDTLRLLDHKHLSERLTLIAKSIHLRFVVVDAIYGLNRRGPMDVEVVNVGGILVGDNPVATDASATSLMGFEPAKIKHIFIASKADLGHYREEEIEIQDDSSPFQQHFCLRPTLVDRGCALCFKSYLLNKAISDSPFTKPIYKIMGRVPRKKIVKPGDAI